MQTRRFLSLTTLFAVAALPLLAVPNFSGTWKLNTSKSDFGQMPPPNSMTRTITHEEPKLKVATKQSTDNGDFESEFNYTTDGKECTNEMRGNPIKSVLKWDGDTLVITSKSKFNDNEMTIEDKWTVSADGSTMTLLRHFSSSMGEMDTKLILEKQ